MVDTFVAVVLGGVISILSQVALDVTRARAQARKNRKEIMTAVRVIRFMLYSAQHVLKEALETGRWWSPSDELNVAAAGEDLRALAELLPEEHWRIYTASWRRLHDCIRRFDAAQTTVALPANASPQAPVIGHYAATSAAGLGPVIHPVDLQVILGAFITVDNARYQLETYVVETYTNEIPLDRICLTDQQIAEAIDHQTSRMVDKRRWHARLRSVTEPS
jgi:hypothetical protein